MKINPAIGLVSDQPLPSSRYHANFIDAYVDFMRDQEATKKIHTWTAISIVAAALERKVWIDHGKYRLYPNLYTMIIGSPGMMKKSTATGVGVGLLNKSKLVKMSPEKITPEALVEALRRSQDKFTYNGKDINHCSMFSYASELTNFIDEKDKDLIDLLTHLYDTADRDYIRETRSHGQEIVKLPCINILACTTPSWISRAIPAEQMEGGFASRFIFVVESSLPDKLIPFPLPDASLQETGETLAQDLSLINSLVGPFTFTQEALLFQAKWYHKHMRELTELQHISRFTGYFGRRPTHLEKLSVVLSASEGDSRVVELRHVERAVSLLKEIEAGIISGFVRGRNVNSDMTMRVLGFIKAKRRVSESALFNAFFSDLGLEDIKSVLEHLVQMRQIQQTISGGHGMFYEIVQSAPDMFAYAQPEARESELSPHQD